MIIYLVSIPTNVKTKQKRDTYIFNAWMNAWMFLVIYCIAYYIAYNVQYCAMYLVDTFTLNLWCIGVLYMVLCVIFGMILGMVLSYVLRTVLLILGYSKSYCVSCKYFNIYLWSK